jgi:hypothetical protein
MRKYAGATCIVLGVVLSGLETGGSVDSGWSRLFAGWKVDRPMLIGGVLSLIVGLSLWLLNGKVAPKEK